MEFFIYRTVVKLISPINRESDNAPATIKLPSDFLIFSE